MKKYIDNILKYLDDKDDYIREFDYEFKRIEKQDGFELAHYVRELEKENQLLKEQVKTIKEDVTVVYQEMISLDIIQKVETDDDVELLWNR